MVAAAHAAIVGQTQSTIEAWEEAEQPKRQHRARVMTALGAGYSTLQTGQCSWGRQLGEAAQGVTGSNAILDQTVYTTVLSCAEST